MYSLVTTRFNDSTWEENCRYRRMNKITGCIYGSPCKMSPKIIQETLVFVIEMNNDLNRIEGIGLVRNITRSDKYYSIYKGGNYNRFTFKGDYRIDRLELIKNNSNLVNILDYILFKEKTHLKRGSGFTSVPEKLLNHSLCEKLNIINEIKLLFLKVFEKIQTENEISI